MENSDAERATFFPWGCSPTTLYYFGINWEHFVHGLTLECLRLKN